MRCLIATAMIAAAQVLIWQVKDRDADVASQAAEFEIAGLPTRLGEWTSEDAPLEDNVVQDVGALKMIRRTFVNPAGYRLAVVLATFPTGEPILPHPPDLCYAGAGWTVLGDAWQKDDRDRPYKLLTGERDRQKVLVSYWYQLRRNVVSNRNELRRELQQLRWKRQAWPPMVKVLIHAPVALSEPEAKSASEDLGAAIYEWVCQQSDTQSS